MPDFVSAQGQPASELPHHSKKELLKRYRTRVLGAKKWRADEGFDDTWERLRDLYRLRHFEHTSDQDRIAVAVTFATINVILPSVTVNLPRLTVWAASEDPDEQNRAQIAEGVLNYWWRHHKFNRPWKRIVKDFLIYGIGWAKVAWRYEEEEVPRAEEDINAEFEQLREQADAYAGENPDQAGALPIDQDIFASIATKETVVREDRPILQRVSPLDVLVDPESTSEDDLNWMAQRIVRAIEEVRRDSRYNEAARKAVTADGAVPWQMEKQTKPDTDKVDGERITLWEFYDLRRGTVSVFTDGSDGEVFLVDPQPLPYPFGAPFVPLLNYEVPDQFFPIGDIEGIEPLQTELDQTRSSMVLARQLDIPKFMYRESVFGETGIDALKSKVPYTGIPIDDDTPFEDAIGLVPRPDVQPPLYNHSQVIEDDINLVSGVSEYARGSTPDIRRTATEASIIQDNANSRAAEKLATIEAALSEVASRLLQLGQTYMTGEQAARVTNDVGAPVFWSFTADDIAGEFDLEVEAGSTQPRNETFRRQQAMQMFDTLQPFFGTGVLNDPMFVTFLLRDGFGIKNPERYLGPLAGQLMAGGAGPEGTPPEGAPPPEGEGNAEDPFGGTDAVDDDQLAQLAGQIGYVPNTLGGGALGPGSAARA